MKRHAGWLVALILVPVLYVGGLYAANFLAQRSDDEASIVLSLARLACIAIAIVGPIVAAIVALIKGTKTFKQWRRRNGHFSRSETAARAVAFHNQKQSEAAFVAARQQRERVIAGDLPAAITMWEIVPGANELTFFDLTATYARFYGQDVTYPHSSGIHVGNPVFVLAGLAAAGMGNSARRKDAEAAAQAMWREWQPSRVVVTNERIICHVNARWLSFYFSAMTAVYPEVDKWTLVCEFGDASQPLLLTGLDAPLIAVMTVRFTHDAGAVENHPSLQMLGQVRADDA